MAAREVESISTMQATLQSYAQLPHIMANGATKVIDVRGAQGLIAYFGSGTVTATPVADADGTAITSAAAVSLTTATRITIGAHFYLITTAGGAGATVLVIG